MKIEIPSIKISFIKDYMDSVKEIAYGIEEEGIPYETIKSEFSDSIEKAYEMSQESKLSVGIAIDHKNLVVHYSKLNKEKPLFEIDLQDINKTQLRIYGSNAARLVKGISFKKV